MELYKLIKQEDNLLTFQNYKNPSITLIQEKINDMELITENMYSLTFEDGKINLIEPIYVYNTIPVQDIVVKNLVKNLNIVLEEEIKTPLFNTEEEAKSYLDSFFVDSSCNLMYSIHSYKIKEKYSISAKIGVYVIENYTTDFDISEKYNQDYNIFVNNIKNNLNNEITYINNVNAVKKYYKPFVLIILVIFFINLLISLLFNNVYNVFK
jgi:hypothetical protein